MQIKFQYTFEEFREAMEAVREIRYDLPRRIRIAMGWFLVLALLTMPYTMFRLFTDPESSRAVLIWGAWSTGVITVLVLSGPFVIAQRRAAIQNAWTGQPLLQQPHTVDFTSESILICNSQTRSEFRWTGFIKFTQIPRLFLLFPS